MTKYKYRIIKRTDPSNFDGQEYYRIECKPCGFISSIFSWTYYDTHLNRQDAIAKCKASINKQRQKQIPITEEIIGVYLP